MRVPAGVLLILGALLSILPFFGLWMLPLGVLLLAEDFAWARRARDRLLAWAEQHRPHWFAASEGGATPGATPRAARLAAATVVARGGSADMKRQRG
jgi:Putative transmembrane protein (PGPGW)